MKIINFWVPAADLPVLANGGSLYYSSGRYHYKTSIMLFYYKLTLLAKDNFYEDS